MGLHNPPVFGSQNVHCLKMPAPKSLLLPVLFWGIAVHAETKSVDYSMEPASFPALAGESQSSDYSHFSVVEPISGLSTVQVPDQEFDSIAQPNRGLG